MVDEEAILKRIIKCYLHFKGEATTKMIVLHIEEMGYGLRKQLSTEYVTRQIRTWSRNNKGSWFNVRGEQRDRTTWWRLE